MFFHGQQLGSAFATESCKFIFKIEPVYLFLNVTAQEWLKFDIEEVN
jgi:hypothetical protein